MPTPTYVSLATISLTGNDSEIIFSSIPATYRDLILVVAGTSDSAGRAFFVQLNLDSGNQSAVYANQSSSYTDTDFYMSTNTTQFNATVQIMDYSATDKHKTMLVRSNLPTSEVWMGAGRWASTAAVNSVRVTRSGFNLNSGTRLSLYGIAA
jgi:hypothetical protein